MGLAQLFYHYHHFNVEVTVWMHDMFESSHFNGLKKQSKPRSKCEHKYRCVCIDSDATQV